MPLSCPWSMLSLTLATRLWMLSCSGVGTKSDTHRHWGLLTVCGVSQTLQPQSLIKSIWPRHHSGGITFHVCPLPPAQQVSKVIRQKAASPYWIPHRFGGRMHDAWHWPKAADVECLDSFGDAFWQHHQLAAAAAETLDVVWHPRDRFARAHLHLGVLVQPIVGFVQQLPARHSSLRQSVDRPQRNTPEIKVKSRIKCSLNKTDRADISRIGIGQTSPPVLSPGELDET